MATKARIDRRRNKLRNGHSVRCWKSKWSSCTCKLRNVLRQGESKFTPNRREW